jgi:hypothetical protein
MERDEARARSGGLRRHWFGVHGLDVHGFLDAGERKDLASAAPAALGDLVQHDPMIEASLEHPDEIVDDLADLRRQFGPGGCVEGTLWGRDIDPQGRLFQHLAADTNRRLGQLLIRGPGQHLGAGIGDRRAFGFQNCVGNPGDQGVLINLIQRALGSGDLDKMHDFGLFFCARWGVGFGYFLTCFLQNKLQIR